VTLIAAFRCEIDNEPGVIVCGDSQETCGEYKATVEKIIPRIAGHYDLIIGGAGNGNIVDSLVNHVERDVRTWEGGIPEDNARQKLAYLLRDHIEEVVQFYPVADSDEKRVDSIICIRDRESGAVYLWRSAGSVVEPVQDFRLVGADIELYQYEVKRLYMPESDVLSTVVLAVHLLSIAKSTSISIEEPFKVIGVGRNGVWLEPADKIALLIQRVTQVNNMLGKLLRDVPDFTLSEETFSNALQLFLNEVFGLRNDVARYAMPSDSPIMQAMLGTIRKDNK
jgi:ATP-dependent protease HslVU (ClpYQ) peptidase subunit